MTKYNQQQLKCAASSAYSFSDFLEEIESDTNDRLLVNIRRLLFKIYELKKEGKLITKTKACKYIPTDNMTTCFKYMKEAEERGFVEYKQCKSDKRKIYIIPKKELMRYVEEEVEKDIDRCRDRLLRVLELGNFPEDNIPLSGLSIEKVLSSIKQKSHD